MNERDEFLDKMAGETLGRAGLDVNANRLTTASDQIEEILRIVQSTPTAVVWGPPVVRGTPPA